MQHSCNGIQVARRQSWRCYAKNLGRSNRQARQMCPHISSSGSGVQEPSTSLAMEFKSMKRDFYTRIAGMEANMKAIITALNILVIPDPNTRNVQQPSSFEYRQSTPNTGSTECLRNLVRLFLALYLNLLWYHSCATILNLNYEDVLLPWFSSSQTRIWPHQNPEDIRSKIPPEIDEAHVVHAHTTHEQDVTSITIFLVQSELYSQCNVGWLWSDINSDVTRMDTLYMEENGRQNEGPTQHELPELEKDNDQEVSSSSREKVATDVGGNKGGGIRTPKKRARATELQKLQVGMQFPQMPRKLRAKHYEEK